jgi:hypothetical protein
LEWINRLVGSLNLKPGLGNHQTSETKLLEAMILKVFISFWLTLKAGIKFAKSLISETYWVYAKQRAKDPPEESKGKIIVPMHVTLAVKSNSNFDFLSVNSSLQKTKQMLG